MLTLPLIFILIANAVVVLPILVVYAVDVDDALVAIAGVPGNLDNSLIRTGRNRGMAETSGKFLLLPVAATMAARILRIVRR